MTSPPVSDVRTRSTATPGHRSEMLYVETSALLRIWLEKDRALAAELRRFTRFFTSALTLIEVPRSVSRARREARLNRAQAARILRRHRAFTAACTVAEITVAVRERAAVEFPIEPVRSLDAIHLATVTAWSDTLGPLVVASCDQRVSQNARALGFDVIPSH